MKFCTQCGTQNEDQAKFCSSCGAALQTGPGAAAEPPKPAQPPRPAVEIVSTVAPENENTLRQVFSIPGGETVITSIGNSYLQNLIMGSGVSQTVAAATNRRFYYQGRTLRGTGLKLSRTVASGSVLLKDISYTGVVHLSPLWKKVVAIILTVYPGVCGVLVTLSVGAGQIVHGELIRGVFNIILLAALSLAPAALFWWLYKRGSGAAFVIKFAGGGVAFPVKYYPAEESAAFQETLTRLVDQAKG